MAGGSGTQLDPYIINTLQELQDMENNLSGFYQLGNDIDATDTITWNSGTGFVPVGTTSTPFSGCLDGNWCKITNLVINHPYPSNNKGLFGGLSGTVKNLGLENVSIIGGDMTGGLVAETKVGAKIEQCYVKGGSVTGRDYVGGLVGNGARAEISNSFSDVTIISDSTTAIGGLCGYVFITNITNCYSSGNVAGTGHGGLIGFATSPTILNCFWDIERSGCATSAGDGIGKTTVEMQLQATYANWDFASIWYINSNINSSYPIQKQFVGIALLGHMSVYTGSTHIQIPIYDASVGSMNRPLRVSLGSKIGYFDLVEPSNINASAIMVSVNGIIKAIYK